MVGDLIQPQCGLCQRTGEACHRTRKGLRFKHVLMDSEATKRQRSNSYASQPTISIVDETLSTAWRQQARGSPPSEPSPRPLSSPNTPISQAFFSSPHDDVSHVVAASPISIAPVEPPRNADIHVRASPRSQYHPSIRCWPFIEPIEVVLFEHFKQKLSLFVSIDAPAARMN